MLVITDVATYERNTEVMNVQLTAVGVCAGETLCTTE